MKKLKIVAAPDSFKECMTAARAARAIARGVKRAAPDSVVEQIPLADGGEGTVDVIRRVLGGKLHRAVVQDPLGRKIRAAYAIVDRGRTAVIEMAAASGLDLLEPEERDPLRTSTFGTGELILRAARLGARRVIVGLGGSATVDGGVGMAQAIGVRLLDARGRSLERGGGALSKLRSLDLSDRDPMVDELEIVGACDVTNPLCGRTGAALVYGPQKGASPGVADRLNRNLRNLARVFERRTGRRLQREKGAGAAGGLGWGLAAFAGAKLRSGLELVLETVSFERRIRGADFIITGEGRLDGQSAYGKVVAGVAAAGKKRGIPVVALAGTLDRGYEKIFRCGVTAAYGIVQEGADPATAISEAPTLLASLAARVIRRISSR
jgi:glycerate kinase